MKVTSTGSYLDLDGPWEVTDVDIKSNVGVASKGELLTRETVSVFLDVCFGHDGHLLSRDGSSCGVQEVVFRIVIVWHTESAHGLNRHNMWFNSTRLYSDGAKSQQSPKRCLKLSGKVFLRPTIWHIFPLLLGDKHFKMGWCHTP